MKYKLRGTYQLTLIETILNNRGIDNKEVFENPTSDFNTKYLDVLNMRKGVELVTNNLDKKIMILVDSDCDGFTSASLLYQVLKEIKEDIDLDYYIHPNKMHGLTKEFISFLEYKQIELVIIPDAGSNDVEEIEYLESKGIKVLILDHHKVDKTTKHGVIINNTICEVANSNLTGVGMAYLFANALNDIMNYGIDVAKYEDLVMLGSVGDGAILTEPEVRYYCERARKNIHNNLIKTFYEQKDLPLDGLVYSNFSFGGIIPSINAIVRAGELTEKKLLFKALSNIDVDYTEIVEKRKLNKTTRKYEIVPFEYNIYELAIEAATKAKGRQDKIIKKKIKDLESQYNNESIAIFIMEEDEEVKSITGLLANKLSGLVKVPTLVMWKNNHDEYIGSARGNIKVLTNLKKWCTDTGLFELAQGHENAFGLILKEENLEALKEKTKNVEKEEFVYEVDTIYNETVNKQHFYIIDSHKHFWCNGCEEPLLAVKNMNVAKNNISLKGSVLKIFHNGISYIKYKTTNSEYEEIVQRGFFDTVNFEIVGRYSINEYNGNRYPQVIIEDYNFEHKNNVEINNFFD